MSKLFKISVAAFALLALVAVGSKANAETWDFGTTTLKMGSSGTFVMNLQTALNTCASAGLTADGSFGPKTDAAVRAFQTAHALVADGLVGMNTKAALNSCGGVITGGTGSCPTGFTCAPTTPVACPAGFTCTPAGGSGTVTGGAGSVDSYNELSSFSNEEVGEDEEDVEIGGIEVEVGDGSDIMVTAVKLDFSTQPGNDDLGDFITEVAIMVDGEEFARVDADEFNDDNDWTKTVTLSDGAIIKENETGEITVAVTGVSNIDSDDAGDDWALDFVTVRFEDGQGATISEDTGTDAFAWQVDTFASAADVELKVAESNDNPEAQVVDIDSSDDTNGVEVLRFTLEANGSDIEVKDIPVLFTVTGATDVDAVINTAYLTIDGEEFSESVSTSTAAATVTFDDIDFTVDEGEEVEVVVTVDVNNTDSAFEQGDTIKAELRAASEVDGIDAEDQTGEDLAIGDLTGSALGEVMSFYDAGIMVSFVSATESSAVDDGSDDDTGTFVLKFTVEAFGGTVYVSDTAAATVSTSIAETSLTNADGILYLVEDSGTATVDDLADLLTEEGDADLSASNNWTLTDGEESTFTLTVTQTNDSIEDDGLYRMLLKSIGWNTTDSATVYNVYDFDLEDFKTDPLSLN